jgi:hypothetical protein
MSANNVTELPTPEVKKRRKIYREYDKYADEGLNNLRKNMDADIKSTNAYFSKQLPVDEMATMGSDTQGIVRDHRNMNPELKARWDAQVKEAALKREMAIAHLKERGYEPYYTKRTTKNPEPKLAFKNKILGKTLKALPIIGAAASGYAALQTPDAGAAAVDAVVPGGVDGTNQSAEQQMLDRMYQERIRQRSQISRQAPIGR